MEQAGLLGGALPPTVPPPQQAAHQPHRVGDSTGAGEAALGASPFQQLGQVEVWGRGGGEEGQGAVRARGALLTPVDCTMCSCCCPGGQAGALPVFPHPPPSRASDHPPAGWGSSLQKEGAGSPRRWYLRLQPTASSCKLATSVACSKPYQQHSGSAPSRWMMLRLCRYSRPVPASTAMASRRRQVSWAAVVGCSRAAARHSYRLPRPQYSACTGQWAGERGT